MSAASSSFLRLLFSIATSPYSVCVMFIFIFCVFGERALCRSPSNPCAHTNATFICLFRRLFGGTFALFTSWISHQILPENWCFVFVISSKRIPCLWIHWECVFSLLHGFLSFCFFCYFFFLVQILFWLQPVFVCRYMFRMANKWFVGSHMQSQRKNFKQRKKNTKITVAWLARTLFRLCSFCAKNELISSRRLSLKHQIILFCVSFVLWTSFVHSLSAVVDSSPIRFRFLAIDFVRQPEMEKIKLNWVTMYVHWHIYWKIFAGNCIFDYPILNGDDINLSPLKPVIVSKLSLDVRRCVSNAFNCIMSPSWKIRATTWSLIVLNCWICATIDRLIQKRRRGEALLIANVMRFRFDGWPLSKHCVRFGLLLSYRFRFVLLSSNRFRCAIGVSTLFFHFVTFLVFASLSLWFACLPFVLLVSNVFYSMCVSEASYNSLPNQK